MPIDDRDRETEEETVGEMKRSRHSNPTDLLLALFLANVAFTAKKVLPLEVLVGKQFLESENKWTLGVFQKVKGNLLRYHLISVAFTIALLVQQSISWRTQPSVQRMLRDLPTGN